MDTIQSFEVVRMSPPADPDYVVICRTDELLYEAIAVVTMDAHAFHRDACMTDALLCLQRLNQLTHCDPVNTGMLISELEEIGFLISTPVMLSFVTDIPDEETTGTQEDLRNRLS